MVNVSQLEYPFAEHFIEREGIRQHYVDEGGGDPVVMLKNSSGWVITGGGNICYATNTVDAFAAFDRFVGAARATQEPCCEKRSCESCS